jgi:hypothetical protein
MATTNLQAFSGDVEIAGGLNITGTLTSTVGVDKVSLTEDGTDASRRIIFTTGSTGAQPLKTDAGLTYNPSTNQLTVDGNVGIGTSTPRTNLHIGQQLNSQGDKNTIPSAGLGISANFPSTTHAWFSNRVNATGDEYWGLAVGTIYNGASYLQNLNKNTVTYYNLLLQPNGGNVGIGVTDPDSKLEVRGNIRASYSDTNHGMFIDAGGTILRDYGGNGAGFHFTTNAIWPTNYLGSYSAGGIDLGSSSYRWNNVYTEALNASGNLTVDGTIYNHNYTEVDITAPAAVSGTWTNATSSAWGDPKFNNVYDKYSYNDAPGYKQFNIPAGMKSAYISHMEWSNGGYVDAYGVQSDGGLVFLKRINTLQTVENSNEGNPDQHDGMTITLAGSGLHTFSAIRLVNQSGRFHLTGLGFTPNLIGTEGTGMVNLSQINGLANSATITASADRGNDTIVRRSPYGYVFANYFNTTPDDVSSGVTKVCVETGNDGYIRHGTADAIRSFIGAVNGSANNVAIGNLAGETSQGNTAVAVGYGAGRTSQGGYSVAIGRDAGNSSQQVHSVAVGRAAGQISQGTLSVAIGYNAGYNSQEEQAVAVGYQAGFQNQRGLTVAVGRDTGYLRQSDQATALGSYAGRTDQGYRGVAIGYRPAFSSQGSYGIAIGYQAGYSSQPSNSFYVATNSVRNQGGSYYMRYNTSSGEVSYTSSDDRVKDGETPITNAVKTLSKLRPQNYFKRTKLDPNAPEQNWYHESGLMAQEVYYSVPEMRHLVLVPPEAGDIDKYTPPPSDDPSQDPDYSVWGDGIASVDYMQMVPYLVKGVQEIVTEVPRSKTTVSNTWGENITGLVVSANTNKHKTNTVPIVNISTVSMDKSWYGVVSSEKTDSTEYDTLVDTKGDSLIWVTDTNGTLESGDLLTTSNVAPGYTQKQEGGALMNYTVAKVTQDCDFTEPLQVSIKIPKRELSNVMYYIHDESYEISLDDYEKRPSFKKSVEEIPIYFKEDVDGDKTRYYQGDMEISSSKYDSLPEDAIKSVKQLREISVEEYNALDAVEKATYSLGKSKTYKAIQFSKSKKQIPQHDEVRILEELVDVLDENGQTVWEETGETRPVYTLVDHGTYKAALVSCKLI